MKPNYPHIILFGFLLLCLSCKKDREVAKYTRDYTITGKVIDEITGKGVAQSNVGIIQRGKDATSHLGGKTVAFDKSDWEGNFTLTFSANSEINNYELTANALTYFEKSGGGDLITFTKNGSKTQNTTLSPYSYLTFYIKGNQGAKEIHLSAGEGGGGISFYPGIDTFITFDTSPIRESRSTYWVFFQDTSKNYKELIVLPPPPPHDTTYYSIEF